MSDRAIVAFLPFRTASTAKYDVGVGIGIGFDVDVDRRRRRLRLAAGARLDDGGARHQLPLVDLERFQRGRNVAESGHLSDEEQADQQPQKPLASTGGGGAGAGVRVAGVLHLKSREDHSKFAW